MHHRRYQPCSHLFFTFSPVLLAKRLPDDGCGQNCEVTEETTSHDVVVWTVKFEEEWFSRLQCAELDISTWLPEVDFIQVGHSREVVEPVTISDADEEAQAASG
jgi:hypothetical protein